MGLLVAEVLVAGVLVVVAGRRRFAWGDALEPQAVTATMSAPATATVRPHRRDAPTKLWSPPPACRSTTDGFGPTSRRVTNGIIAGARAVLRSVADQKSMTSPRRAIACAAMERTDVLVVGAGIVGLGTARAVKRASPDCTVTVVEKEPAVALHQSGRNSGVIHAGVYYPPGSDKARFCTAGRISMVEYCKDHGIDHAVSGKVVVALDEEEATRLRELERRCAVNAVRRGDDRAGAVGRTRASYPRRCRVARTRHRHCRLRRSLPITGS